MQFYNQTQDRTEDQQLRTLKHTGFVNPEIKLGESDLTVGIFSTIPKTTSALSSYVC